MSDCRFESDVLDALASRRWPARAGAELQAHVRTCRSCADLAAVAGALLHEEEAAFDQARVPAAGAVWHRAQLRAREDAARAATRPIGFAQGVAFTFAVAAAIAVAAWGLPILAALAGSIAIPSVPLPSVELDAMALLSTTTVQIAAVAWAVLIPLALYFTLREDH